MSGAYSLRNRFASMFITAALGASAVFAGTTWDGGDGSDNWNWNNNWSPDGAPTINGGVDLTFAGTTRLNPYNNYADWSDLRGIYFASGAGSFTLTGNSLDLYDGKIENNDDSGQTVSFANLSFNNGSQEINPVSGNLTLGGGGNIYNNGLYMDVYGDNGHTLTLGMAMQGAGGISINQNSIVNVTVAQTYTGDTFVNEGSLRIDQGGSLGGTIVRVGRTSGSDAAGLYISDANGGTTEDATIVIRDGSSGTLTVGGLNTSGDNTFSGGMSLDNSVTLSAAAGGRTIFSGAITDGAGAGTYGAAINAAGTVRLSGTSANSGQSSWTVQAGTLELGKSDGVNAISSAGITIQSGGTMRNLVANQISDAGGVTVNNGGTWDLNSFNETVATLNMDGALSLGTAQLIVNGGPAAWDGTFTGSAGSSVVKKSSDTISITGNNSGMAGNWYIVGGIAGFNNNNAGGSGRIFVGETSGSDAATIDISSAGVVLNTDITIRDGSSGTKTLDNASGGTVTFSGDILLDDALTVSAVGSENTILSGAISQDADGDSEKLVKTGSGTVTLSGTSTYTGNTEIDQGTLVISGDLANGSKVYIGSGAISQDATLQLSGSGATIGDIQVNVAASGTPARGINVTAGNHTISGTVDLNRDATITASGGSLVLSGTVDLSNSGANDLAINNSVGVTISGAISAGTGSSEINKSGTGTLTLSGDNSGSSFMLNIAGGTVALNHANALGTAYFDKINFTGSGTLDVNANIAPAALGVRVSSGQTATIDVNGGNTFTVAGALASVGGAGTFIQTGAGTVRLTGVSTYSGTYNLNQGTLTGDGEIRNFVQNGGVLSPGNSPGTWVVDGSATWNGGSYLWEINDLAGTQGNDPGWDFVNISGALNITAAYNINIDDLGALAGWDTLSSYSWRAITAVGGITGFGNLGLVTTAWNQNPYGGSFALRQTGNDIWIDYTGGAIGPGGAVPEPNTIVYFGLAFVGLIALRSRKTRVLMNIQA